MILLEYVQGKYQVAKSVLVEAINDKCAQARRKKRNAEIEKFEQ